MAKFRLVHTSFWNDPNVIEEMTPEDKFFFLYLLTNEHTTQIGIYGITKKQIAFEMGYSMETINALMQRFLTHHELIRFNEETREIAIKNWGKYNLVKGGKPIIDCVVSELKHVKDISLIEYVAKGIGNATIKALYDTYHDTCTSSGQEKEEEEEKEEDKEEEKMLLPPSHPLIDNSFLKIQRYFEEKVIFSEAAYEHSKALSDFLDDYHDAELIIKAMDIAVERGKPHLPYINGILKTWRSDGIKNIQQLKAKEVNNSNGKTGTSVAAKRDDAKQQADAKLREQAERLKKFL